MSFLSVSPLLHQTLVKCSAAFCQELANRSLGVGAGRNVLRKFNEFYKSLHHLGKCHLACQQGMIKICPSSP